MARKFNTTGHNSIAKHYCIDPFTRLDWQEIEELIDDEKFFVLHAPRQSGKTTLLEAIVNRLNGEGRYDAMRFSVQSAQSAGNNYVTGMQTIVDQLFRAARYCFPKSWLTLEGPATAEKVGPGSVLSILLTDWAANSLKPLVLLIDEIDALVGDTLVSALSQLRDGYIGRPIPFPHSIVLCGVRDVRDYRISTSDGQIIRGGSCFNVKATSLRLGNFSVTNVRELYSQHTAETGQRFEEQIYTRIMDLTGGQPWLVNALANEMTQGMPEYRDRTRSIGLEALDAAKDRLIIRRETHLDDLAYKLKDDRIRRVIVPILNGGELSKTATNADREYVADLGLIVVLDGSARIANMIYREVIPRQLACDFEDDIATRLPQPAFLLLDGRLDFRAVLKEFQKFYRETSEAWTERVLYPEVAPHIMLQAWLQRVVNCGGQIEREFGLGTGRADILVRHRYKVDGKSTQQRFVIELKVVLDGRSLDSTIRDGLEQTARYADRCNPEEAHLVVVDPGKRSWEEKVYVKEMSFGGRAITVWGI